RLTYQQLYVDRNLRYANMRRSVTLAVVQDMNGVNQAVLPLPFDQMVSMTGCTTGPWIMNYTLGENQVLNAGQDPIKFRSAKQVDRNLEILVTALFCMSIVVISVTIDFSAISQSHYFI